MKYLAAILLMALLSVSLGLYFPWWVIAPACFLVALVINMKPGFAFLCGFVSVGLLWGILAWTINYQNGGILANKISLVLFKIENQNLLVGATAVMGGLIAAFSSLSGALMKRLRN